MLTSSTVPTEPALLTGAMSKNLRVVVLQLVGLGVVVVLGPFLDRITSSQFHLSWVCGLAEAKNTEAKMATLMAKTLKNPLFHILKCFFHIMDLLLFSNPTISGKDLTLKSFWDADFW